MQLIYLCTPGFARKGQHRYSHSSHLPMVYIPGITKTLYRRKGGGKGGGKSGSGSSSSGTKSNFGGLPSGKTSATTYGNGGGPVSTIQSGSFVGRTVGGGTRDVVFGNRSVRAIFCRLISPVVNVLLVENRKYGSGYPGYPVGVAGYGFPFYFWPLAFGGGLYGAHYIHDNEVRAPRLHPPSLPHFLTVNCVSPVRQSR